MKDQEKTKEQLINELVDLRRRTKDRTRELRKTTNDLQAEIKEHKRTEAAFIQSGEKYHGLFNTVPEAIMIFDSDTRRFIDVNESVLQMYGYTREEFLKLKQSDISSEPEASDLSIKETLAGKRNHLPLRYHRKKDGTIFPVEISACTFPIGERQVLCGVIRDITKRKKTEEALWESEERYRSIFEQAADSIVIVDSDGTLVEFNNIAHQNLGYTRQEFEKLKIADFEVIESEEKIRKHLERIRKKGGDIFETKHTTKNGEKRDILVNSKPITIGGKVYFQSIWRDITERKQTESALRQSEQRFRTVAEFTYASEYWIDPDNNLIYQSPSVERITGYTVEEVIENHPGLFSKIVHPSDKEQFRKHFAKDLSSSEVTRITFRIISRSGEVRWLENITRPVYDNKGNFLGRRGSSRDISARKEAEEELKDIFNLSPDMVAVFTTEGKLLKVNPSWEQVLGYTQKELLDLGWIKLVHPDDVEKTNKEVEKQLKGGSVVNFVNRYKCKDGSYKTLEWQATYAQEGIVHATARDITERKLMDEKLRESEARLTESNQLLEGVLEHTYMMAVFLDPQFNFIWVNRAYADTCRHEPSFFPGKNHFALYPHEENQAIFQRVLDTGEPFFVEAKPFEFPDQPERGVTYWDWCLIPVKDGTGKVTGLVFTLAEVTERIRAEAALTQRLDFEQLISGIRADFINLPLDNIDEGINRALETIARFGGAVRSSLFIVHDNQTKATNTHEWCAQPSDSQIALLQGIPFETFGYYRNLLLREEYVVIRNIDDLPPEAHREREWSKKYGFRALLFVPMILKGFLYGTLGFYGQVGEEKDWSPHFVSLLNLVADVFVSVLERKRAEETQRLQSEITANMSEGVYLIQTSDMVIVYTNPKFAEMFGYGPDEMVGQHVSIVNAPTDLTPEQTVKAIRSEIEKGGGYWQGEVKNIKKDGKPFWCHASVSVFDHPEYGEVLVTVHTDITERKLAEEELQKSREELNNLAAHLQSVREMERTSIAREIHDELGQALTVLKMDLFWLRKRLPEDQTPYLGKIQSMVDLTDRTIDTMKRISTDLRPSMLDDLGLVAAIQWQAEEFEKRMGIKCDAAFDFEEIELDEQKRTAIFRIFQETLTNIARHADATRTRIYLRKRAKNLELEVRDNGKGITEEQISNPKAYGLIGMRERVQFLEGEVTISGAPDRGTKVLVKIPLADIGAAG